MTDPVGRRGTHLRRSDKFHFVTTAYRTFTHEGPRAFLKRSRLVMARAIAPSTTPRRHGDSVDAELDEIAVKVKKYIRQSPPPQDVPIVRTIAQLAPWFQRVELPQHGIATTDDPSWRVDDPAQDNRLFGRLTQLEASTLRPLPKWEFIKTRIPDVTDKRVLEIGSSCGFFSFEFAKAGAAHVTGVEVLHECISQSNWLKDMLGFEQVDFVQSDFSFDDVGPHDIVFTSDAIMHLICPFFGISKALMLASEAAVFDTALAAVAEVEPTLTLRFDLHERYHSFYFNDLMMTQFLIRCGVQQEHILKYPYGNRCLYVVKPPERRDLRITSADDPLWSRKFDFRLIPKQRQ